MADENWANYLMPKNEVSEIVGKVSYHDSDQAWNTIRLKKELLDKFPQLKEKQGKFCYKIKMCSSHKHLKKEINSLEKGSQGIPLLLFLCRKND